MQSGSEGSGPGAVRIFVGFGVRLLAHPKNFLAPVRFKNLSA